MDMLAHCRAMAAFCRQRARFEDENDAFWIGEAEEWDKLIIRARDLSTPNSNQNKQSEEGALLANDRDEAKLSYILLKQMQSTANRSAQ
jgi:hypothetical protein